MCVLGNRTGVSRMVRLPGVIGHLQSIDFIAKNNNKVTRMELQARMTISTLL